MRPERLTWLGGGGVLRPVAWKQASVVFASSVDDVFGRPSLYEVPASGGQPTKLYASELDALSFAPTGDGVLVARHTNDPVVDGRWKGYRGGQHGMVWIDRQGKGAFEKIVLTDPESQDHMQLSCPMWLQDKLFFVAELDGSGNLWSVDFDGSNLEKLSDHTCFDARTARGCGGTVVYTCGGDLWFFDLGGKPRMVPLDFGAPLSHLPTFLDAEESCEAIALHPDGRHVACTCRGQAFEMPLWEGPAVPMRPAGPDGGRAVRCLAAEYLYSGRLVTVSDEALPLASFTIHPASVFDAEEVTKAQAWLNLLVADAGLDTQHLTSDAPIGSILEMVASPAHDAFVVTTARHELLLVEFVPEVGDKPHPQTDPIAKTDLPLQLAIKLLDKSEWEEGMSEPTWSSDGEWLAYVRKDSRRGASIVLLCLETGEKTVVADSSFLNSCPCFASGRFLSFLSCRTFAPLWDDVTADMNFQMGAGLPYLALLQKDAPNPFQREVMSPAELRDRLENEGGDEEEEEDCGEEEEEEDEAQNEDKFQPPEKIEVDTEGIASRILPFPLPVGNYRQAFWNDTGKFLYLRGFPKAHQPSAAGDEEEEGPATLFVFNFLTLKETRLADSIQDYQLSMDLRNMLLTRVDEDGTETYQVNVAAEKPPQDDDDTPEDVDIDTPGPESGILDLTRISLQAVASREWAQIFEETAEHVRENYFDKDTGGVDWMDTCNSYRAILPRLRCRADLTDLLSELLAELGVSHMSTTGPSDEDEDEGCSLLGSQGHLGVEASWQEIPGAGGAYRVDRIARGDAWDAKYGGPMARAGVGITVGSYIIAVNRTRVCREVSLKQMLANSSGTEVLVTFVLPESAEKYAHVQGLLQKSGGVDGFRKLSAAQRRALHAHGDGDGKKKKKDKKKKEKKKDAKAGDRCLAEAEKKLAATLSGLGVEVGEGPIWTSSRVKVVPTRSRYNAALRDFVEGNLQHVHGATDGRVGYVHVPDTCELGFAEFYRYFGRECDREALIVDLRCNGGGYATELFLKQLRNKPIGWSVPRQGRGRAQVTPELCSQGALVLLVDENTCSDGECWAEAFHRFGMGKIVGMRTWGGVVAIGGADIDLIDGGSVTIPFMHWFVPGRGYGLENRGAEPDVVVEWPPAPAAGAGEDPQLAEAIRQAEQLLPARPAVDPAPEHFPRTRLHRRQRQPERA